MDSFEDVVATLLEREGYWVRKSVKVALTREEKQEIGRPSSPRDGSKGSEETRYKLFTDAVLRRVVLSRLERQLVEQHFCPEGTKATLCLAAGKIYRDPAPLRAIFQNNGSRLFEAQWLSDGLHRLAHESYDNSIASIVAKLLLRERGR